MASNIVEPPLIEPLPLSLPGVVGVDPSEVGVDELDGIEGVPRLVVARLLLLVVQPVVERAKNFLDA